MDGDRPTDSHLQTPDTVPRQAAPVLQAQGAASAGGHSERGIGGSGGQGIL